MPPRLSPSEHDLADAARFLLLSNSLVLLLDRHHFIFLLRRGMAPLESLAAQAASHIAAILGISSLRKQALAVAELAVLARALESLPCAG